MIPERFTEFYDPPDPWPEVTRIEAEADARLDWKFRNSDGPDIPLWPGDFEPGYGPNKTPNP